MKIVLVNLPWYSFGKTGVRAGSRWPHLRARHERVYLPFPFFLAYAAALLKKHNYDVVLIDAIAEDLTYGAFLRRVGSLRPSLLVCETSTVTLGHDIELIKKINARIPVALCGPDANIRKPDFLKQYPFITYVFSGEYEYTLLDLVNCLKQGGDKKEVLGLIYRDEKNVVINPPRPLAGLDTLPWPLREGLPMTRYNDAPGNMPLPSVQMIASRGCPYRCKFCLWPQVMYQGNSYRTRDVADVVSEMEYAVRTLGFKSVYFDDDTFNCGKARMLAFCSEIKKRKLNDTPWAIMARPDLMDEELLCAMKDAGLYAIKYGVESATQGLLDNINKNMDLARTEQMIRLTQRLGIKTHLTFTFGLPGETKATIRRTIEEAVNLNPNSVQFSITTPFPGTEFYQEMEQKGYILSHEWSQYDGNYKSVICSEHLKKEDLEMAIRRGYREWADHAIRRRYLLGQRLNLTPPRLFLYHVKKYGVFRAALKSAGFFLRLFKGAFLERYGYFLNRFKRVPLIQGVAIIGRLTLVFGDSGIRLLWDNRELTRQGGFTSWASVACEKDEGRDRHKFLHFKKIGPAAFTIEKKYIGSDERELWAFDVIDEKQFDWSIKALEGPRDQASKTRAAGVILSEEYRNWVDSWGEGGFYPVFDKMEVELRNPKTKVIGVRGRKKTLGIIPTILLDASRNNGIVVSARNSDCAPGARILAVNKIEELFTARVKIVEEDFTKRKSAL
jgi:anaerobic magnesium-protoporphyrin IX monomethyl ester cyclase